MLAVWALGAGICQAQAKMSDEARGRAWWAHVQVLADDSMQGRLTGSEDYMRAAAYVVGKFKAVWAAAGGSEWDVLSAGEL